MQRVYWPPSTITCVFRLLTAHKRISYLTWRTATYRIVVYDSTASPNTTRPRARICAMLVHTCQGLHTVRADNTLRSTNRWSTSITRKTRTGCKTLRWHKTPAVWTTWRWVTWVCWHRKICWDHKQNNVSSTHCFKISRLSLKKKWKRNSTALYILMSPK
jgi:hypothetical protein